MRVLSKRQESQSALLQKRGQLDAISERLQEMVQFSQIHNLDDPSDDDCEDILGEGVLHSKDGQLTPSPSRTGESVTSKEQPGHTILPAYPVEKVAQGEGPARLRPRKSRMREHSASDTKGESSAIHIEPSTKSDATSITTTEQIMSHNRYEQEALTTSMVSMAAALKASSIAFATSLEDEKGILDNAAQGMDKNELGMGAAQRKMGLLRTYSEGKGWWGRMMLYAWIGGLWVAALLIVFGLPKLRF